MLKSNKHNDLKTQRIRERDMMSYINEVKKKWKKLTRLSHGCCKASMSKLRCESRRSWMYVLKMKGNERLVSARVPLSIEREATGKKNSGKVAFTLVVEPEWESH
jgi:hypothetical protein